MNCVFRSHTPFPRNDLRPSRHGLKRTLSRDELISRLAVAKSKADRAWKLIPVPISEEGDSVTPTTQWHLDWPRTRETRAKDEGSYLLHMVMRSFR